MQINSKLTDKELFDYIYKAAAEYNKLLDNTYLIIGKNKNTDYYWFECSFEKKNFMHLLGIKSKNLSAEEFFDKCNDYNNGIGSGITKDDCTPSRDHNRKTINEKCSCCAELLMLENIKFMKFGDKDKISLRVDFNYAYGNEAILGFEKTKISSFPKTLIPQHIDNFSTKKHKIILIFKKTSNKDKYINPFIELKSGIFVEHYENFPENLKEKIQKPV